MGLIFAQAVNKDTIIVSGSVCPETDSVGGHELSTDGYDAYGEGFTFTWITHGEYKVTLTNHVNKVLSISGEILQHDTSGSTHEKLNVIPIWPNDGKEFRFDIVDSTGTKTDISYLDRFCFTIIVNKWGSP